MENNNFGIKDIFIALKKQWIVILLTFIFFSIGFALYTNYFILPVYSGSTKVSIGKPLDSDNSYNASDITNYNGLVDVFSEYIKTNDFVSKALEASHLNYNSREVLTGIQTTSGSSTPTITIIYSSTEVNKTEEG